eukprot:5372527-Pyramimonas_sp.AAC.1
MEKARESGGEVHAGEALLQLLGVLANAELAGDRVDQGTIVQELSAVDEALLLVGGHGSRTVRLAIGRRRGQFHVAVFSWRGSGG